MSTYKAWTIPKAEGLDSLKLVEQKAQPLEKHEVRIQIKAVSLNYRDLMVARGVYSKNLPKDLVPCSDGAGVVTEVGSGVTRVKKGDRVAAIFNQDWLGGPGHPSDMANALGASLHGTLAENVSLSEQGVVKIPDYMSFEEASTVPCAGVTVWSALFDPRFPLLPGQTVLTQGTGGVSLFAIQLAKAAGAKVIVTSSSDEKLQIAKKEGADVLINYKTHPNWEKEVLKATNNAGVDHVVEIGGSGTLAKSIESLGYNGAIHVIGVLTSGDSDIGLSLIFKRATVRGVYVGSRDDHEALHRAMERHQIHPLVDKVFPFDKAVDAYKYLEAAGHVGKVVISVNA